MRYLRPVTKFQYINAVLLKLFTTAVASMLFLSTSHAVEPLPTQSYLTLALAQTAANDALKKCTDDGLQVSVAVVDRSGVVIALLRGDGAGPHTVDSSSRKAYTAASMGRSTLELANFIKDKPEVHGVRDMNDKILILGGGLPIKVGDEVVGAIGVGGAPSAELDEACAKAGIDAILEKDK
jgi:uncharacterized protein GlcG (DUF336 family)